METLDLSPGQTQNPSQSPLDGVTTGSGQMTEQAAQILRDSTEQMRERAQAAADKAAAYARDEPVKALLIAAATGALLMGVVSLMGRSSD